MYQTSQDQLFPVVEELVGPSQFYWRRVEMPGFRWNLLVIVTVDKDVEMESRSVFMVADVNRLSELVECDSCVVESIELLHPRNDCIGFDHFQLESVRVGSSDEIENNWVELAPLNEKPIIYHDYVRSELWEADESKFLFSARTE